MSTDIEAWIGAAVEGSFDDDGVLLRGSKEVRVAHAICGDWHRAADLLRTAFTRLYLAWPRLRREGQEEPTP